MELICEIVGREIPYKAEGLRLGQLHHYLTDDGGTSIIEDILQVAGMDDQLKLS